MNVCMYVVNIINFQRENLKFAKEGKDDVETENVLCKKKAEEGTSKICKCHNKMKSANTV